ncbi:MAG TPA: hypothetical protein VIM53_02430 [Candidatus Saccharimonadales bacterium]
MTNPVRRLQVYYEAEGHYAVDRGRGELIVYKALGAVGSHTSLIDVDFTPMLQTGAGKEAIFDAKDVRFEAAPHTLFLTGRGFTSPNARPGAAAGMQHFIDESGTRAFVHVGGETEKETAVATARATREIAHTFGVEDCPDPHCITSAPTSAYELEDFEAIADPFCGNCAENLELAGYQALATEL